MILILASGGYGKLRIEGNRKTETQAKELAKMALAKLAEQASLHAYDPQSCPESYIGMGNLRDDVLRDEFSASRRTKLWEKVQKKVEQNSNVRSMVRESRTGDVGRLWEWVGAVAAIEDGRGSGRRQSGRYSLPAASSPLSGEHTALEYTPEVKHEMKEVRHWDDSRPIY